jgi:hypothetical protein
MLHCSYYYYLSNYLLMVSHMNQNLHNYTTIEEVPVDTSKLVVLTYFRGVSYDPNEHVRIFILRSISDRKIASYRKTWSNAKTSVCIPSIIYKRPNSNFLYHSGCLMCRIGRPKSNRSRTLYLDKFYSRRTKDRTLLWNLRHRYL